MATQSSSKTFAVSPISIILMIGCIMLIGIAAAAVWIMYQNSLPTSQITVQGSAKRDVTPDKAVITLRYEAIGDDFAKLNSDADTVIQDVKNYLLNEAKLKEHDIIINKMSPYDYWLPNPTDNTQAQTKKRIEATFQVTFTNFSADTQRPNSILRETISRGITGFSQFSYEISDSEKLCQELENEAIKTATTRGEERVKSLGGRTILKREHLTGTNSCGGGIIYPMNSRSELTVMTDDTVRTKEPPTLMAGAQQLVATAEVRFEFR